MTSGFFAWMINPETGYLGHGGCSSRLLVGAGADAEELDHVADLTVATGLKYVFNAFDGSVQLSRRLRIQLLHGVVYFAHHVVGCFTGEIDLPKAGTVVEEAATYQTQFLKRSQTTIDRHQITEGITFKIIVDLLDAGGLLSADQRIENCDTGLRDAQAGRTKTSDSNFDRSSTGRGVSGRRGSGFLSFDHGQWFEREALTVRYANWKITYATHQLQIQANVACAHSASGRLRKFGSYVINRR